MYVIFLKIVHILILVLLVNDLKIVNDLDGFNRKFAEIRIGVNRLILDYIEEERKKNSSKGIPIELSLDLNNLIDLIKEIDCIKNKKEYKNLFPISALDFDGTCYVIKNSSILNGLKIGIEEEKIEQMKNNSNNGRHLIGIHEMIDDHHKHHSIFVYLNKDGKTYHETDIMYVEENKSECVIREIDFELNNKLLDIVYYELGTDICVVSNRSKGYFTRGQLNTESIKYAINYRYPFAIIRHIYGIVDEIKKEVVAKYHIDELVDKYDQYLSLIGNNISTEKWVASDRCKFFEVSSDEKVGSKLYKLMILSKDDRQIIFVDDEPYRTLHCKVFNNTSVPFIIQPVIQQQADLIRINHIENFFIIPYIYVTNVTNWKINLSIKVTKINDNVKSTIRLSGKLFEIIERSAHIMRHLYQMTEKQRAVFYAIEKDNIDRLKKLQNNICADICNCKKTIEHVDIGFLSSIEESMQMTKKLDNNEKIDNEYICKKLIENNRDFRLIIIQILKDIKYLISRKDATTDMLSTKENIQRIKCKNTNNSYIEKTKTLMEVVYGTDKNVISDYLSVINNGKEISNEKAYEICKCVYNISNNVYGMRPENDRSLNSRIYRDIYKDSGTLECILRLDKHLRLLCRFLLNIFHKSGCWKSVERIKRAQNNEFYGIYRKTIKEEQEIPRNSSLVIINKTI